MRLGVVVTSEGYKESAGRLLRAAIGRGWEWQCFLTDRGVLLLGDPDFVELTGRGRGSLSLCELSLERYGGDALDPESLPDRVVVGGQMQDAQLVRESDRVIVL
ncbi:MAG: hypothetical protein GWO44_07765 [Thermoplasmata archaeon]|nr:hypothetical protein [Thermoplasmata archaeon]NIY03172.1 hypothetical protein [Thermoplasmata archaeon]